MCETTCPAADVLKNLRDMQGHLREYENQCDNAQGNFRTAGSVWTLAGIGGLAGAVALDTSHTYMARHFDGFGPEALMSFVCFLIVIGLDNLWSLDQFVYQRLLHSVFAYGMMIEDYLDPRERLRQAVNGRVHDITARLSTFYAVPIGVFLAVFLVLNLAQSWDGFTTVGAVCWLLFAICVVWSGRLLHRSFGDDVGDAEGKIAQRIAQYMKDRTALDLSAPPRGTAPTSQ